METVETLHMNKGAGETSYATNSFIQRKILSLTKEATEKAIMEILCSTRSPLINMGIADLGCSSGPNVFKVMSEIVEAINAASNMLARPAPEELMLYMNDLFTNDFNNVFASLPSFHKKINQQNGNDSKNNGYFGSKCFVSAVPGTFYGRLFPTKSIHFVHSSSSIHWLSRVPGVLEEKGGRRLNKGNLCISKNSPNCVLQAYSQQFQNDLSCFLKSRSQEMVYGGRMVLSFLGRQSMEYTSSNCYYQWELLARALKTMVSEGLVKEEKVDSFNAPYYACCYEELKMEIKKEGSFSVDSHEAYEVDWDDGKDLQSDHDLSETMSKGERFSRAMRAAVESILEYHFGNHLMDELFQRYAILVEDHLSKNRATFINLIISLVKQY
ncbi:probable jasmonic acid carboxyl methyltransferase 2 [Vicia villosa]|uniref:probable jasmonic acid carboxyl methyltransferase 2 n=1 Tax=Vicia villosa TaxID=3911 RepID=UPI00273CB4B3|nr:probable jasmonic acid carboxyl methyltransferase 2 [Vicia villosa]